MTGKKEMLMEKDLVGVTGGASYKIIKMSVPASIENYAQSVGIVADCPERMKQKTAPRTK